MGIGIWPRVHVVSLCYPNIAAIGALTLTQARICEGRVYSLPSTRAQDIVTPTLVHT
jgi:hypothetical protein